MRRLSWLLARITRWVAYSLVFFITLEAWARLDDWFQYRAPIFETYTIRRILGDDENGIRHNIPNARFEKWIINAMGFRGGEVPRNKAAGEIRIACLGSSESFGTYESAGKEWPEQLAELFRKSDNMVVVLNTSVVGQKEAQRKRYMERYVSPCKPDLLILYVNFMEFVHPKVEMHESAKENVQKVGIGDLAAQVVEACRVAPKLKEALKRMLPTSAVDLISLKLSERMVSEAERTILRNAVPMDMVPEENVQRFKEAQRELVGHTRELGVLPVLCTYPTFAAEDNLATGQSIILEARASMIQYSEVGMIDCGKKFNQATRDVAQELGVVVVDCDRVLPKTREYFADYLHYTDAGASLIAMTVFQKLCGAGLLENRDAHIRTSDGVESRPHERGKSRDDEGKSVGKGSTHTAVRCGVDGEPRRSEDAGGATVGIGHDGGHRSG